MQASIQGARPPYARFEVRAVEDREASIQNKYYSTKDVHYALITPSGSRDIVEKIVSEWFEVLEQAVREERFPVQWLEYYRQQYEAWQRGVEASLEGTDIRNWAVASPSQINALRAARLFTVEDLASANEEALGRLGMGGRELKQRAVEWLSNSNRVAAEANQRADDLQKQIEELKAQLAAKAPETKPVAGGSKPL